MKNNLIILLSLLLSNQILSQDNVGINISPPLFTLDVRGTTTAESGILNLSNSDNKFFFRLKSGNSGNDNSQIIWPENTSLTFNGFNGGLNEFIRIDHNGNLGIGINNPVDKLEVRGNTKIRGNIHTDGEILPDGIHGNEGQLLKSDGSGGMYWGDVNNYRYFQGFPNDDTWVVPSGVSEVLVEIWGAGGGGDEGGGGGGGSYLCGLIYVTPGETLTIDIGSGGEAGIQIPDADATFGEASYVYQGSSFYKAFGGFGANAITPGIGGSGGTTNDIGFVNYYVLTGQHGMITETDFAQASSTNFVRILNSGHGGNGANTKFTGGKGGLIVELETTGTNIETKRCFYGQLPGGGGGGWGTETGGNTGCDGAKGYVIIRWN